MYIHIYTHIHIRQICGDTKWGVKIDIAAGVAMEFKIVVTKDPQLLL